MTERQQSAEPTRARRVLYLLIGNLIMFGGAFTLGELATRWYIQGSAGSALASLVGRPDRAGGVTDGWLIRDAELGYRLNPRQTGVSSIGIRHADIEVPKRDGLFRFVVLGDSVAWDTSGFVTLMRQRSTEIRPGAVEVINGAIPGYTTYQERRLFERDLVETSPDLVVLQYCLNDNHRFLHQLNESGRWLITPEAERVLVPGWLGPIGTLVRSSYLLLEIRVRLLAMTSGSSGQYPWDTDPGFAAAWQDATWGDVETHLRAIQMSARRVGARFAIVAVPLEAQLDARWLDRDRAYTLKPQRRLVALGDKLDIPVLDLHSTFLAAGDQRLYSDGIHLTPSGHELAAGAILRFIKDRRLAEAVPPALR
jgi:lysophospholipase L1-like esterase